MPEDTDALLEHYRHQREQLLAAIDGLTDAQLSEPTLDGWSVKDHLAHLGFWDDLRALEVTRISFGFESAWHMTEGQDNELNALVHEVRTALSPAQAKWELATSRQRLIVALASAEERGLDGSLYGEAGLKSTHEAQHTEWIKRWRGERGY